MEKNFNIRKSKDESKSPVIRVTDNKNTGSTINTATNKTKIENTNSKNIILSKAQPNKSNPKEKEKLSSIKPVITKPKTYGKYNFFVPSLSDIKRVIDYSSLSDKDKKLLLPLNISYAENEVFNYNQEAMIHHNNHTLLYRPINIPKPSDWLYEYKEGGQSFKNFSTGMVNQPSKTFNTIYINILDNDLKESFLNKDRMAILISLMKVYFPNIECELMPKHYSFNDLKIEGRQNYYLQYNAGQAIERLKKVLPKKGLLIVGVTMTDIYPRDEWNFVYGLANKMEGAGVFSFRRHYDELADLYPKEKNIDMLVCKKAAFTMIHEVGHLFGLKHCIYYNCIMNGHNHQHEKSIHFFCPVCLKKLQWNLKLDLVQRYEGMLQLYQGLAKEHVNDFDEEISWLKMRMSLIES